MRICRRHPSSQTSCRASLDFLEARESREGRGREGREGREGMNGWSREGCPRSSTRSTRLENGSSREGLVRGSRRRRARSGAPGGGRRAWPARSLSSPAVTGRLGQGSGRSPRVERGESRQAGCSGAAQLGRPATCSAASGSTASGGPEKEARPTEVIGRATCCQVVRSPSAASAATGLRRWRCSGAGSCDAAEQRGGSGGAEQRSSCTRAFSLDASPAPLRPPAATRATWIASCVPPLGASLRRAVRLPARKGCSRGPSAHTPRSVSVDDLVNSVRQLEEVAHRDTCGRAPPVLRSDTRSAASRRLGAARGPT